MTDQSPDLNLSPLDQIRQTEADVLRKIVATRIAAEEILENGRQQSAAIKREAQEAGTRQGQVCYKELIAKTEEEAKAIVIEAQGQADRFRRRGLVRMHSAVDFVILLVVDGNEK
jgi:vacuolar-type H+-ATPase subunit H